MSEKLKPTSRDAANSYDTTIHVFESLFREIKEISKKKPDIVVSAFKVKQVNRLLVDIKRFLEDSPEGKYLDLLEEEALPQASDVVVVMSQYEGALKAFRERHYGYYRSEHQWVVTE